jgi:hypothetical protein
MLQLKDRDNLNFADMVRPVFKANGDLIARGKNFDIKNGTSVFYEESLEIQKASSLKLKYNKNGQLILVLFEVPNTLPQDEIFNANNLLLQNPETEHMSCLSPNESNLEQKIQEGAKNNPISRQIHNEALFIASRYEKDSYPPEVFCQSPKIEEFDKTVDSARREKLEDQQNQSQDKFDYESLD